MPKKSEKEQCFEDTWNNYKEKFDEPTKIEFQKPWGQLADGSWRNNYNSFWHAINSFKSWQRGTGGTTTQPRFPDLTVNSDGKTSVVDLKFTRKDGSVDSWGEKEGKGNGNLQQDDYNDINKKQNGGDPQYNDDPSLTPEKCGCNKPNGTAVEPVRVYVDAYAARFFVVPGPLAPGVSLPPLTAPSSLPGLGVLGGLRGLGGVPRLLAPVRVP